MSPWPHNKLLCILLMNEFDPGRLLFIVFCFVVIYSSAKFFKRLRYSALKSGVVASTTTFVLVSCFYVYFSLSRTGSLLPSSQADLIQGALVLLLFPVAVGAKTYQEIKNA